MKNLENIILGINRRKSGAFEHAWELAQNMNSRNFNVEYYSQWFDDKAKKMPLDNTASVEANLKELAKKKGVFHLHSHTWDLNGFLDTINSNSKIIYTLHAFLPYYYLSGDEKISFLKGELPKKRIDEVLQSLNSKEQHQIKSIQKADYLITIASGLKTAIQMMGIKKPVFVLENVSDVNFDENILDEARVEAKNFREKLESDNVLLYCGRIHNKKGPAQLMKSFNYILDDNQKSKLILLGEEYDLERAIENGLKKENFDKLHIVPWIDKNNAIGKKEILKYYFSSDVLIQPMITDGLFSKAVIDAMHLGIPTITCRSPYSFGSSFSAEDIYNSFIELKNNPDKANKIVSLAKNKVRNENNWDNYIRKLSGIIYE